jgi:hypothetical protein
MRAGEEDGMASLKDLLSDRSQEHTTRCPAEIPSLNFYATLSAVLRFWRKGSPHGHSIREEVRDVR